MKAKTLQQLSDIVNTCSVKDTRRVLMSLLKEWITLTEPRWDDYTFPAQGLNPPGSTNDPDRDSDDGSLLFDADRDERIVGSGQVPHATNLDSYLHPHVHWIATDDTAGDIVWQLDYKVFNIGDPLPSEWTSIDVVSPADQVHAISYFPEMPLVTAKMSTLIMWRLTRLGTDVRDTYPNDIKFLSFDVHYQKDKFGSVEEIVHDYGT